MKILRWTNQHRLSRHTMPIAVIPDNTLMMPTEAIRTNVAIVGFTDKVRRQAPYDDPTWEVWGFNMANRLDFMKDRQGHFRADRWFDLHPLSVQDDLDMAWIETCPVPLYLTEPYEQNPNALVYPLEAVNRFAAQYGMADYYASSFAYAIALALYEGFQTIGLFGADLDWGRERVVEHGNLCAWVGLARGLGREVIIPAKSALLTHPARYGFDYHAEKTAVEQRMVRLLFELLRDRQINTAYDALLQRKHQGEWWNIEQELWGHLTETGDAPIADIP